MADFVSTEIVLEGLANKHWDERIYRPVVQIKASSRVASEGDNEVSKGTHPIKTAGVD